ncbi:hypothetical protein FRC19_011502 [Serendipita sp. 401]|nr:hypothetical protein FRC19_011502 [Serendipita sp. 401]
MSTPSHPTMQDYQSFLRLLNAPGVHERTRAVFISLLANCEDEGRLCSFVLQSVTARVNHRSQSDLVHRRSYGPPAIHMTEELRVMFETIGKRVRATRRAGRLFGKSKRPGKQIVLENPRRGPSASTDVGRQFQEVELFPKSSDAVRISRFRNLVDIFHGGHSKSLSDKNLASRANTVLIDRRWVSMFDNGAFHLRFDDEQIYPVLLWGDASAFIPTCSPINRSSSLRPRVKSVFRGPIGPDKELVSLHALILQTWYDTGLSERLVADIHLVDDMPSISQQVSVLGDSMFSQILQHRLALL